MVKKGRLFSTVICAIILNCALAGTAIAGFWSSDDKGKSGLDFNHGYDINTVSKMSGRVISQPHPGEKEYIIVAVQGKSVFCGD